MPETLAVGLLGLGSINDVHARNLAAMPDVRIAAVWDFAPARAAEVAARHPGCRAYADYRELIETAGLDALFIAIPPYAHEEHETLAARRGIPFLVEKPVALGVARAREIEREIVRSGVLHAVGYHMRYTPQVARAREQLAGARVGLALGHTFWKRGRGALPTPHHVWLFQKERSGGQLHEHTTHLFDLARYLLGEVRRVYARSALVADHSEIEGYATTDVDAVHLEFASGALGLVSAGHFTPRAYLWDLRLLADEVILELDGGGLRTLREETAEEYRPAAPHGSQHYYQDAAFLAAVRRGDRSLLRSSYSDALRSAAISLAANESAATGRVVEMEQFLAAGGPAQSEASADGGPRC